MGCGYQWESEYDQEDEDGQCHGHHECILQEDHDDAEHECACGDVNVETN